ncbi:flagellar basal body rod protein FlgC [Jannaschia aquimarina]|uniref:FlgC protein n=1 Tax=Jannaschia aquimarina TaxID=935700 RepID=A0A0D1CI08_9RHOB|nr:flagellar basal body rod protein FlgC [Jannaschia aquimarina]KIT14302.1 Flagellar basal-body rod protein FlgC [Jannaschia aquimarina]SNS50412.1 flagellar basal-body rod protein FlgC [Jannaschia aquimarina]
MAEFSDALRILSSGLRAQGQRLRHVSENISNADTPGYRRKTVSFHETVESGRRTGAVEVGKVMLDRRDLRAIHDPSHPLAGPDGFYDGSNVDLVTEIADARQAQRSYEANLKMFDQTRRMSSALFDLLKR